MKKKIRDHIRTVPLRADHIYLPDRAGNLTEFCSSDIRVVDDDGKMLHAVGHTRANRSPHRDYPAIPPSLAQDYAELFAQAPSFLAALEEIAAGNLDGEGPQEFSHRCVTVAKSAVVAWQNRKAPAGSRPTRGPHRGRRP